MNNKIIKIDAVNDENYYIVYMNDKEFFKINKRINKLENIIAYCQKFVDSPIQVIKE